MTSDTHVVCYVYDNNSEQRFVNDGTEWFFFFYLSCDVANDLINSMESK